MNIQIRKAISHFFPSPSFPQVYSEAVANAIDAKADYIEIDIKIKSYNDPESLNLRISDNGEGFTDESFNRFSSLLDAKDKKHKGLGRLLFLEYFKGVSIRSVFSLGKGRKFLFDEKFKGKFSLYDVPSSEHSGTILEFGNVLALVLIVMMIYVQVRLNSNSWLNFNPFFWNERNRELVLR